jgi:hypothetical protein
MSSPGLNLNAQVAADPQATYRYQIALAQAKIKQRASWFNVIAALSLVNAVIALVNGQFHFLVGLGITDLVSALGQRSGGQGAVVALIITAIAAGAFWGLGRVVTQGQKWALILGMVLYALDGAVILLWQDWLSIAFHGYGLFRMFGAFEAIGDLQTARQNAEANGIVLDQQPIG